MNSIHTAYRFWLDLVLEDAADFCNTAYFPRLCSMTQPLRYLHFQKVRTTTLNVWIFACSYSSLLFDHLMTNKTIPGLQSDVTSYSLCKDSGIQQNGSFKLAQFVGMDSLSSDQKPEICGDQWWLSLKRGLMADLLDSDWLKFSNQCNDTTRVLDHPKHWASPPKTSATSLEIAFPL